MRFSGDSIEELFKSSFQDYRITPEPAVWTKLEKQLAVKNFFRFRAEHFNIYYLSTILSIVSILSVFLFSSHPTTSTGLIEKLTSEKILQHEKPVTQIHSEDLIAKKDSTITNTNRALKKSSPVVSFEKIESITPTENNDANEMHYETILSKLHDTLTITQKMNAQNEKNIFRVELNLSKTEGCVPLTVDFWVIAEGAKRIEINCGNGKTSQNNSFSTVYDKAGKYIVSIKAYNDLGKSKTTIDTITVFETPKPIALVDADENCKQNCIVYFYNYTQGATRYVWDFGDRNYSLLKDPVHIYTETEIQSPIKLKVTSEKSCTDSIVIESPFSTPSENFIVFPTAFVPSEIGSNNGFYNLNSHSTDIFYPVSKGIVEYKLEVFSRTGILLFQTTDINQGWDGYYKYKLMPQNVYIWRANGKFLNQETFELMGDITLIRK
jgi:PKD repeat protein